MARSIICQTELPELGTCEAALKGCIDLIARMCGQSDEIVQYWLDLYFQTRLSYAVQEEQRRRDAKLIERIPKVWGKPEDKSGEAAKAAPTPEAQAEEEAAPEAKASEGTVAEQSPLPPPEPAGELAGFEPVTFKKGGAPRGNTNGADAAKFKRETAERLRRMRADGITSAKIVDVSNGSIKQDTILDILDAKRVPIAAYRLLATVLDKIEES